MLMNLNNLRNKYNLNIKGVIHIGAHYCREFNSYKLIGIQNVMCFEPLTHNFEKLKQYVDSKTILYQLALGNDKKEIEMNVEYNNESMSSSILEPFTHLKEYPHIKFTDKIMVKMDKLDNIEFDRNNYDFINIDVQGYELEVFKGSINTIEHIKYIMSEVNKDELYKGCARVDEIDDFLGSFGFIRVETEWTVNGWADAFYIKKK
jgi:FkbM family methyltransferase